MSSYPKENNNIFTFLVLVAGWLGFGLLAFLVFTTGENPHDQVVASVLLLCSVVFFVGLVLMSGLEDLHKDAGRRKRRDLNS